MKITLWDEDGARLQESQSNLSNALKKLCIKADILCQSEPPLLARMGLTGTTPVVELYGNYWRCEQGKAITSEQFISLLKRHAEI